MGSKTSKNKPKANEQVTPSEEKILDDSSSSKSSSYYEEAFVPEPIDPKAKTVKVYLYKLDMAAMSLNMGRGRLAMFDEIFIPQLGVCVNFCQDKPNIVESDCRRNDELEHKKSRVPILVPDTKYYVHGETEIPIELYNLVEQVVNLRKQTQSKTKLLKPLEQFICNAPTEQAKYTNPMVKNINDMDNYFEDELADERKKNKKHHDSN